MFFDEKLSIVPSAKVRNMCLVQKVLASEHLPEMQRDPAGREQSICVRGQLLFVSFDGLLSGVEPLSYSWCHKHQPVCSLPLVPPEQFAFHSVALHVLMTLASAGSA